MQIDFPDHILIGMAHKKNSQFHGNTGKAKHTDIFMPELVGGYIGVPVFVLHIDRLIVFDALVLIL